MPKVDLEDLTNRVFSDIHLLLDSFDIEYTEVNKSKICFCCPIHGGDNETGLSILTTRKTWNCWTHNCHEDYGRNIFGFVQGVLSTRLGKQASFKDALIYLVDIYGSKNCTKKNQPQKFDNNLDFIRIAKCFKEDGKSTISSIDALDLKVPSEYFLKRNFKEETLKRFGVGESDVFKNRAMIPIDNENGKLVGYICRATKPYVIPKFIFTEGITKTNYLYNYYNALPFIRKNNAIILVEGQGDVWRLYEAGILNAVGCFGKDLSKQQIKLMLQSGVTNLIALLDDDEAGREAKFKIQRELHKLFKIKFPSLSRKDAGDLTVEEIQNKIYPQIKGLF